MTTLLSQLRSSCFSSFCRFGSFVCPPWLVSVFMSFASSLCSSAAFGSTLPPRFPSLLSLHLAAMDHAQGRAFHHHLARAISTIWRGFCPFSHHPLSLTTGPRNILFLVNLRLIGDFILLSPYLWLQIHRLWSHMEDSHHVLFPTLSTISDPLQRTPLIDRGLSLRILHIPPPLLAGHLFLILCLFTRTLWLIHILNPDLCLTFQAFQLGQPSRYLCGPKKAPAWSMTRNPRRNTRLKPYLPLLHQHPVDRKTRVTYRWMMTLTTPTRGNLIELLQSVVGQKRLPQLRHLLHPS